MEQIDFKLLQGRAETKSFRFTDSSDLVYNFTDHTIIFTLYKPGGNITITSSVVILTDIITIEFSEEDTEDLVLFEYTLESEADGITIPLVQGNIEIVPYVPFTHAIQSYLSSELPANIVLKSDYINQKVMYWRKMLQSAFNISDANLNIESAWPDLVNALFAKLVVHDALLLAFTGSTFAFFGGDYTVQTNIGDSVKKIETGPSSVEFFSPADGLVNLFKKGTGGDSPFDELRSQICGLANHLGIKIPHCKSSNLPIIPKVYKPE